MSGVKLSYEKGKPIAYIKKDKMYRIIYLHDEEEEKETRKEINNDRCLKCIRAGCMNCSENCKGSNLKCCNLCK